MNSKVFVSCGQHTAEERQIARRICDMLQERGFRPYLAIDAQTILDINGGIISELKTSDCYLFVNFRREAIGTDHAGHTQHRGSLFSNQELAIAYALGIERILIINQAGVKPEGMLAYIGVNTETFQDGRDCAETVGRALDRAGWGSDYSRQLAAGNLRFEDKILTYGSLAGWFLYLDVRNPRPDIAALEATGRLSGYSLNGRDFQPSTIRSPLKATGRSGFAHTIFPKSHEAFDLLCVGMDLKASPGSASPSGRRIVLERTPCHAYLNSAFDVEWTCPLPLPAGRWTFRYEFFAVGFPVMTADIEVEIPPTVPPKAPRALLLNQ